MKKEVAVATALMALMSYMGPVSWAESIEDKKAELDEIQRQMDTNYSKCYSLLGRSYDESYDDSSDQAFLESIHTMTMMHRAPAISTKPTRFPIKRMDTA